MYSGNNLQLSNYKWSEWGRLRGYKISGSLGTAVPRYQPIMLIILPILLCCTAQKVHLICLQLCSIFTYYAQYYASFIITALGWNIIYLEKKNVL